MIASASISVPQTKFTGSQQQTRAQGAFASSPPPNDSPPRGSAFSEDMSHEGRIRGRSAARDACRASTIVEEGPQDLAGVASSSVMQGKITYTVVMFYLVCLSAGYSAIYCIIYVREHKCLQGRSDIVRNRHRNASRCCVLVRTL